MKHNRPFLGRATTKRIAEKRGRLFIIPAGTTISFRRKGQRLWVDHVTEKELRLTWVLRKGPGYMVFEVNLGKHMKGTARVAGGTYRAWDQPKVKP